MLTQAQREKLMEVRGTLYGASYFLEDIKAQFVLDLAEDISFLIEEDDKERSQTHGGIAHEGE